VSTPADLRPDPGFLARTFEDDRYAWTLDEHRRRLRAESVAQVGVASGGLTSAAWAGGTAVVALTGHTALALCMGFLLWMAAGLLPSWRLGWSMPEED
jgi:hypothetical protein